MLAASVYPYIELNFTSAQHGPNSKDGQARLGFLC